MTMSNQEKAERAITTLNEKISTVPKSSQHSIIKTPTTQFLFILLGLTVLLAACGQKPATYPGRILLLYIADDMIDAAAQYAPGIYELRQGQTSPQLLWGDLPVRMGLGIHTYPILSPDMKLVLLRDYAVGPDYLLNLQTGEGHIFPTPLTSPEDPAVFSPDNRYLAYVPYGGRGLHVIDLETVDLDEIERITQKNETDGKIALQEYATEIFQGKCTGYVGCSTSTCLAMYHPFWVDNQTLLVSHDKDLIKSDFEFGSVVTGCGGSATIGANMITSIQLNGTILSHVATPFLIKYPTSFDADINLHSGPVMLMQTLDFVDGKTHENIFWLETSSLVGNNPFTPQPLEDTRSGFYSPSPDNKFLLRYNKRWELVDLVSGKLTELQKRPAVGPLYRCVWSQVEQSVVCLGQVERELQLFLLPLSGEPAQILQSWKANITGSYGWFLLASQP